MNKLIRIEQVQEMTSLGRSSIYGLISNGKFPKQLKVSVRKAAWIEQEVLDWVDDVISKRDVSV